MKITAPNFFLISLPANFQRSLLLMQTYDLVACQTPPLYCQIIINLQNQMLIFQQIMKTMRTNSTAPNPGIGDTSILPFDSSRLTLLQILF